VARRRRERDFELYEITGMYELLATAMPRSVNSFGSLTLGAQFNQSTGSNASARMSASVLFGGPE